MPNEKVSPSILDFMSFARQRPDEQHLLVKLIESIHAKQAAGEKLELTVPAILLQKRLSEIAASAKAELQHYLRLIELLKKKDVKDPGPSDKGEPSSPGTSQEIDAKELNVLFQKALQLVHQRAKTTGEQGKDGLQVIEKGIDLAAASIGQIHEALKTVNDFAKKAQETQEPGKKEEVKPKPETKKSGQTGKGNAGAKNAPPAKEAKPAAKKAPAKAKTSPETKKKTPS